MKNHLLQQCEEFGKESYFRSNKETESKDLNNKSTEDMWTYLPLYKRRQIKKEPKKRKLVLHYCDKCEYSSSNLSNVEAHIQALHNLVKYKCDICIYV